MQQRTRSEKIRHLAVEAKDAAVERLKSDS